MVAYAWPSRLVRGRPRTGLIRAPECPVLRFARASPEVGGQLRKRAECYPRANSESAAGRARRRIEQLFGICHRGCHRLRSCPTLQCCQAVLGMAQSPEAHHRVEQRQFGTRDRRTLFPLRLLGTKCRAHNRNGRSGATRQDRGTAFRARVSLLVGTYIRAFPFSARNGRIGIGPNCSRSRNGYRDRTGIEEGFRCHHAL